MCVFINVDTGKFMHTKYNQFTWKAIAAGKLR